VCGGSSALALIGESAAAAETRAAAHALSTADPTRAYHIGTALPASTPQANRRLASGTLIKSPAGGSGRLTISNGGTTDAAVTLVTAQSTKPTLTVYVRASSSYTVSRIKDGQYEIYVTSGTDWDPTTKAFTRNCGFAQFDQPAQFNTPSRPSTQYSITLTPAAANNAKMSKVNPDSFPG
jgi:hypothetical protein